MTTEQYNKTKISDTEFFTLKSQYINPEYIGNGSYGVVVKAFDCKYNREVAIKKIKCIDPIIGKYWFRELTLLKSSNNKHTVSLLDVFTPAESGQEMEEFYIVMEYMENTLDEALFKSHSQVALFVYQLLIALRELHENNIIHRDVKPSNIGIRSDYTLKLLDFGMAREKSPDNSRMTSGVQTLIYRAPEIFLNSSYDYKVDIWSLGCIFAELLTGEQLFKEKNELQQLTDILRVIGNPSESFISNLPTNTQKVFKKCEGKKVTNLIPDSQIKMEDIDLKANDLAKDLLSNFLKFDPDERISVDAALKHPYFEHTMAMENYMELEINEFEENTIQTPAKQLPTMPTTLKEWRETIYKEIMDL